MQSRGLRFKMLKCLRGGFMFRFVSRHFTLVALAFIAVQLSVAQDAGSSPETEQRVERVTSGLTGDVAIKGEEHTTHTLADRMKELN
jgi:uncharacterized protein YoxC